MLGINMTNVDAATGGNRPGAGGYVIQIRRVEDRKDKAYIEVEYDITEGPFKGYYADLFERRKWWGGKFRRSYKEKALPFFKAFIGTVQESNGGAPGLVIGDFEDIDETKLPGLTLGIVYGMEEYMGNDGIIKQRPDTFNAVFMTPDAIREGEYEVPELKPYEGASASNAGVVDTTVPSGFERLQADDTPF